METPHLDTTDQQHTPQYEAEWKRDDSPIPEAIPSTNKISRREFFDKAATITATVAVAALPFLNTTAEASDNVSQKARETIAKFFKEQGGNLFKIAIDLQKARDAGKSIQPVTKHFNSKEGSPFKDMEVTVEHVEKSRYKVTIILTDKSNKTYSASRTLTLKPKQ